MQSIQDLPHVQVPAEHVNERRDTGAPVPGAGELMKLKLRQESEFVSIIRPLTWPAGRVKEGGLAPPSLAQRRKASEGGNKLQTPASKP